jgi:hypothetical protein
MRRLISIWRELAVESASWCSTSATLDIKKLEWRVEHEGESFFTITLPQFGKDFERSLELGYVAPDLFGAFKKRSDGLPLFLGGFLEQVFDTCGALLDDPSIDCIESIRELTLVFGKIERPCTKVRVDRAMRKFVQLEEELGEFDSNSLEEFLPRFRKASTLLWADVFSHVENSYMDRHSLASTWFDASFGFKPGNATVRDSVALDVILGLPHVRRVQGFYPKETPGHERSVEVVGSDALDPRKRFMLVPKHGPGATADGLRGNAKYSVSKWPVRLENVFPHGDYAIPVSWRYDDQLGRAQFLEPGAEVPVKVTPVPKTLKTPRIIAIEPTAMQYAQQAFLHQFVDALEHGHEFLRTIRGKECDFGRFFVGFNDQEPNRFLAKKGSQDGTLATLDLSEASDRVLNSHVELLFERFPRLSEAIQATRSTKASVPGYGVIPLSKFASMGSALCFPIEAMVFTTIVMVAISAERKVPLDRAFLTSMRGNVRVFGDDIVVPKEYVRCVIRALEAFGLKVNLDKSFWNGKFRESCGGDYYEGEWVTPVRLRKDLPQSRTDAQGVMGLVAFRNLLYWKGYWKTTAKIDEWLVTLFKGDFPVVEPTSPALGRQSVLANTRPTFSTAEPVDKHMHRQLVRAYVPVGRAPRSETDGVGLLQKFLLKQGVLPFADVEHTTRQGRPDVVYIKRRRVSPY